MMIDGERSIGNIGSGYERMTSIATPAIDTLLEIMGEQEVSLAKAFWPMRRRPT
jgi:hypothetical protein